MKERNKKPRAREICFPDLSGLFAAFLMRKVEKMKKASSRQLPPKELSEIELD